MYYTLLILVVDGNHYMAVYCYADDICLLSPTLSGLKELLKLYEDYALQHKIIFNASKSQLLYFPSTTARVGGSYHILIQLFRRCYL